MQQQIAKFSILDWLLPLFIAFSSFFVLIQNEENVHLSDTIWATHVYASFVYDNDTDLSEFKSYIEDSNSQSVREIDNRLYSYFPLGTPLLAAPILFVVERTLPELADENLHTYLVNHPPSDAVNKRIHLLTASFIVALTAVVIFFTVRYYIPTWLAVVIAIVFIFGTSAYSTASRTLWQHGPSMLMLAFTLLLFARAEHDKWGLSLAGFTLACAYVIRPSNSISVLVFTIFTFLYYRQYIFKFLLASSPVAILFFVHNYSIYNTLLHPYFAASRLGYGPTFVDALIGNLISPGRGLIIFSPFLIILPFTLFFSWRLQRLKKLDWALLIVVFLHWVSISLFGHWWGGFSFGPRFFSDILPLLIFLLARSFGSMIAHEDQSSLPNTILGLTGGVLAIISIGIHHLGATQPKTWMWNSQPVSVDTHPDRIWDWQDVQFLRPFNSNLASLAVTHQVSGGDTPVYELQLSNLSSSAQTWEFELINGSDMLPLGHFTRKLTPSNFLLARYKFAVETYDSHFVQLQLDQNVIADLESIIKVNIYDHDGNRISEKLLSLSQLSEERSRVTSGDVDNLNAHQIYYGTGWYPEESFGTSTYRWGQSPAVFYLFSPITESVKVNLVFGEMYDPNAGNGKGVSGRLSLIDSQGESIDFSAATGVEIPVTLDLSRGLNRFSLQLEQGNFSPNDLDEQSSDRRMLSFVLEQITLVEVR